MEQALAGRVGDPVAQPLPHSGTDMSVRGAGCSCSGAGGGFRPRQGRGPAYPIQTCVLFRLVRPYSDSSGRRWPPCRPQAAVQVGRAAGPPGRSCRWRCADRTGRGGSTSRTVTPCRTAMAARMASTTGPSSILARPGALGDDHQLFRGVVGLRVSPGGHRRTPRREAGWPAPRRWRQSRCGPPWWTPAQVLEVPTDSGCGRR